MRLVALDIGNTKMVAGLVDAGRLELVFPQTDELAHCGLERKVAQIHDWCIERLREGTERKGIDALVISSVVPASLELWRHLWNGREATRDVPQIIVHPGLALPYAIDIHRPETIGADRLCNVGGALALGLSRAIVVDLGTANTYDLLWEGRFVGGLIGPGFDLAHRTLAQGTAQLPSVPFARPEELLGRDTAAAITSGSFHQAVGAVSHVVQSLWDRYPDCPVLLTGGLAAVVGSELPFSVLHHPHLTLEGAAFLAEHVLRTSS